MDSGPGREERRREGLIRGLDLGKNGRSSRNVSHFCPKLSPPSGQNIDFSALIVQTQVNPTALSTLPSSRPDPNPCMPLAHFLTWPPLTKRRFRSYRC